MKINTYSILLIATLFSLSSCKPGLKKAEAVENYAHLVLKNYKTAYQGASDLQEAVTEFTSSPSEVTLQAAKDAWLASRESYLTTEAFRFQDGPIDLIGENSGPEATINAWPLDESYIDYVQRNELSGIINDTKIPLTKDALIAANEVGGEENISVGYHAIEFLLWGQDVSAPALKQAGNRPFTDFVVGGTAANQNRRKLYLNSCAEILLEDLQILIDQWKEGGAYRTEFLAMEPNAALGKMMTGMATLAKAELAGERMFVAYDNRDQEDEHSCFSDNTHRDTRLDLQGIHNVYFATFAGEENYSIHNIMQLVNTPLAEEVKAAFDTAEKAVAATAIPFDFAITNTEERPKVLYAVKALRTLGDKLVAAGVAMDVEVGIE